MLHEPGLPRGDGSLPQQAQTSLERPLSRKILIATIGSLGDLHPYIAVARALKARGARPVIVTAPEYREDIERAGVEFAHVGPGFAQFGDYQKVLEKLFDVRYGTQYLVREIVMKYVRLTYQDFSKAAEGASLLVSHPLTVSLPLIAEQRRLPWVQTVLSPLSLMSVIDPPLIAGAEWMYRLSQIGHGPYRLAMGLVRMLMRGWEKPLREFRREVGLPPQKISVILDNYFSPHLNLALFDPPLAKPQPDWPPHVRVTGAPLHDGTLDSDETRALNAFLAVGEPPLVFALGSSAVWVAGDFWKHAVEATRQLGRRAVLITGRDTRAQLGSLPPEIRAFDYLPYSMIFPRAAAVIHQAGIGTLSQALRSGHPQLIVPFAFDQPDNARRAAALGLARVMPLKELTAPSLTAELRALLADPRYPARAGEVGRELAAINGAERAADALLAIA